MPHKVVPELYSVWQGMKARCLNSNNPHFSNYGGRGITVCEQWVRDFSQFKTDMGPRPSALHTLDRVDNDGPYSPENCRWATRKVQQRNRRVTLYVEIEGSSYMLAELVEQSGLKPETITDRASKGMPLPDVLSKQRFRTPPPNLKGHKRLNPKTHCVRGHEFTAENTRITPEGFRNCRECHRLKMMRRKTIARRSAGT